MSLHTKVCLVVLGTFIAFLLVQNECRKLEGYKFPVYTTAFCPRIQTEWTERSSALKCNKSNGYMCIPNESIDQLLEFCYREPVERVQKGICLYLIKSVSLVQSYNCSRFEQGCPDHSFFSSEFFKHPACISIGNRCFLAEQSCKSITPPHIQSTTQQFESVNKWNGSTTTHPQQSSEHPQLDNVPINDNDDALLVPILLGIVIPLCFLSLLCGYYIKRKYQICKTIGDGERAEPEKRAKSYNEVLNIVHIKEEIHREETEPLIGHVKHDNKGTASRGEDEIKAIREAKTHDQQIIGSSESHGGKLLTPSIEEGKGIAVQEPRIEKAIFDQWKQDDIDFISTTACDEVEKNIKSKNLVIVVGHSGSGKSAIIQHIALKYREQGWTVKRVKNVKDIVDEYNSSRFQKNKTICVFNDPLGKEYFDEILNNSWQTNEEELKLYLETAKLVMSCRNHIISDHRVIRYLVNPSYILNIDDNNNKLSVKEKRQILNKYTSDMNFSNKDRDKIVEVERYFPLLCKLYSSKEEYKNKGIEFFTEPVTVLKEEILGFRYKDNGKYCALALLVLFNDDLCVSEFLKTKDTENKFKHTLKLCGLPKNTPPSDIEDILNSMKGFFVQKIEDRYHFYHDFVMEVTTHVFGTYYPAETIKYADISFLRRRVKLKNCNEHDDSFTIYLSDKYVEKLGERLFTELFGERLLDVVLNPCLRNENVIEEMKKKIADHPKNHQMLVETKKVTIDKQELHRTSKNLVLTKLSYFNLEGKISPLFAVIAFCHTQLSKYCLNNLQNIQINFVECFPALCCNGSIELFSSAFKDHAEVSLKNTWGKLYPIHIVSVFHNYELFVELIKIGVKVNEKTDGGDGWTPLLLAAGNNTENGNNNHKESGAERRDKTVQLLLKNGAEINLCNDNGVSPLYIACQNGHDSTVQLLLSNGADINLCKKNGSGPLYIACDYGHDSTVQLLLSNGADINLCKKNGASPLYIACQNGHDSTVQLLLSNGADINLCEEDGAGPLSIACRNGHDSTVQLLLSNGADINLCKKKGFGPFHIACCGGRDSTVQLLLSNGADINLCEELGGSPILVACFGRHDSTVQLLLSNGADINLCMNDGFSPLYIACECGHDSTVQLLLSNGADINLCNKDGFGPLHIACCGGHDSTVQLLLSNGADISLCKKNGAGPLYMACEYGHDSTVQLLLSNGADINLCKKKGTSPLYIACQNGHDSIVQLLLSNGADSNLCTENGFSPLHQACSDGHDSTVQLLLSNGADINLYEQHGASPLYIACQNGHDSTVQLLLSNGADINLCREDGTGPLYLACEYGHDSTVQLLLSNGADINLFEEEGASPLHIERRDKTVQLLLSNGADINLCEKEGASPLYIACENGHDSTVQLLLSNGADINLCAENGAGPLYIACFDGHDSTVQLLLSNGADINLCAENGASPLYLACEYGHDSTVQLLLSNGADINLCEENGFSPLYTACQNGQDSTVQLLLSNGADIDLCMNGGVSILFIAFVWRRYNIVNNLLNNGANTSLACGWKVNPALVDCFDKQDCTVVFLMQKDNISNNLYDPDSYFSLFVSCQVERVTRMIF